MSSPLRLGRNLQHQKYFGVDYKCSWRTPNACQQGVPSPYKFALHIKGLTRRDLLGLLNLLESTLGFNPGILCTLASLGEFALLIRNIALQGLAFLNDVLELLLDLTNLGLVFLAGGLLLCRFLFGLLDFLESTLGFTLGILHGLMSFGEFGFFIRHTLLQGLAPPHSLLELLLNFNDPGLVVFTSGLFLGRLLLGLGYRLLKSLDFGRRS